MSVRTLGRWLATLIVILAVIVMAAVGAGIIYYSNLPAPRLRGPLAALYVAAIALGFAFLPRRRRTLAVLVGVFIALVGWEMAIPASNGRDWQPDVSVTPWASVEGEIVTVHGVRHFDYRTETDFVPRWEDRRYDLRALDSVDLIAVYWAGKAIAHIMLSFGFGGSDYLAFSIETRKERGEAYSTLAGFFKQYELVYVAADERDVIGVRTTYRQPPEDVYIYPLRGSRERARRVFLDYIGTMNDMRERPRFYNTLTTNCTTGILVHARVNPDAPPFSWKVLLSGFVPEYLYDLGRLDRSHPFPELEHLSA